MEEVPPKADLALFHQRQILQLLARVGFSEAILLVLCLLRCKMVSIQMICSLPNEREIQQVYSPVIKKRRKKKAQNHKELCVSI